MPLLITFNKQSKDTIELAKTEVLFEILKKSNLQMTSCPVEREHFATTYVTNSSFSSQLHSRRTDSAHTLREGSVWRRAALRVIHASRLKRLANQTNTCELRFQAILI